MLNIKLIVLILDKTTINNFEDISFINNELKTAACELPIPGVIEHKLEETVPITMDLKKSLLNLNLNLYFCLGNCVNSSKNVLIKAATPKIPEKIIKSGLEIISEFKSNNPCPPENKSIIELQNFLLCPFSIMINKILTIPNKYGIIILKLS